MRGIVMLVMSLILVLPFWALQIGASEQPKDSQVERKANTKSDGKNASTKDAKKASIVETKCGKCHKGDKDVRKINEAKGIKNLEEMIKLIRQGQKAEMHKKITDKELKAVGKELFEVKKTVEPKKKEEIKKDAQQPKEKPQKKKPEGC
ncbi:MAG: hypothetical protein N2511_04540 [Thermodesulfovibrionales bacterium]|nr:hypothetical protein [Thermodesulfovibrionales bacterium]